MRIARALFGLFFAVETMIYCQEGLKLGCISYLRIPNYPRLLLLSRSNGWLECSFKLDSTGEPKDVNCSASHKWLYPYAERLRETRTRAECASGTLTRIRIEFKSGKNLPTGVVIEDGVFVIYASYLPIEEQ